jgi:predicted aspartyl protease
VGFTVECEVGELRRGGRSVKVGRVLVDSGAEFTWLPRAMLGRVGVSVAKRNLAFVLADGRIVKRSVGYAILRANGFETVDEVVFAELGDLALLGSRTLEGFGAVVDARGKRLVAAGPHSAAGAAPRIRTAAQASAPRMSSSAA